MRLEEVGLRVSEDFVLSHNAAGEVLNQYVRHKTPLELWRRNGLRQAEYEAGQRYGAIWMAAKRPQSPPHSDTTRIMVDGSGMAPEPLLWASQALSDLSELHDLIGDPETAEMLDRLCGMEDWPPGDKRRFKRKCRRGLEVLASFWRKR